MIANENIKNKTKPATSGGAGADAALDIHPAAVAVVTLFLVAVTPINSGGRCWCKYHCM